MSHVGSGRAVRFAVAWAIVVGCATAGRAGEPVRWEPVGISGGGAMYHPAMSPVDGKLAIVHCDMSATYLTRDGGASWRMIPTDRLRSNTRCRSAFDPVDRDTIYSPDGWTKLAVSHDGGEHWRDLVDVHDYMQGPIAIDPHHHERIIIGAGRSVRMSRDAGANWQTCRGPSGEFVGAHFADDPARKLDRVFVATDAGVWRSDDGGATWATMTDGLPTQNPRCLTGGTHDGRTTLYCTLPARNVGGRYVGGIYRWRSGDQQWQCINGPGLNLDVTKYDQWASHDVAQYHDIATTDAHPDIVYAASDDTGVPPPHHATVFRSDDAGKTWRATFYADPRFDHFNVEKDYTVVEEGQYYQDLPKIAVDAHDPDHVLQINGGQCYITTDGGRSWQCGHTHAVGEAKRGCAWRNTGLVVTTTWHYFIDPHEPRRRYICYTDIGFSRSVDGGDTWIWWSQKGRAPWRNTCYDLAFDPDRAGRIWGAFSNIHDIPNANIIYNRHNHRGPGGVCVSDDFGATWKSQTGGSGGLPIAPAMAVVVDPHSPADHRTLYAGVFSKGVYKSTDGGATWLPCNHGLGDPSNMRVCNVQLHRDGTLFALITARVVNGKFQPQGVGLYRSTDGGASWTCITKSAPALWPKDFTVDPHDSRIIYMGLCDANREKIGGLYRTTDGGGSWTRLVRLGDEHFGAYLSPFHPGWIYATLCEDAPKYGLYLSKDNGKTFEPLKDMPFDNTMRITFDPHDAGVIYVSTFGGSVWRGPAQ